MSFPGNCLRSRQLSNYDIFLLLLSDCCALPSHTCTDLTLWLMQDPMSMLARMFNADWAGKNRTDDKVSLAIEVSFY